MGLLALPRVSAADSAAESSTSTACRALSSTRRGWHSAPRYQFVRRTKEADALGAVFSGSSGGHLSGLGPLIGEVAGVKPAAITFERTGGSLHAEVAGALSMSSDQLLGMDGQGPAVIENAPFWRGHPAPPASQGEGRELSRPLERRIRRD